MSTLGLVFGAICFAGAVRQGLQWWRMDDDKAGLWFAALCVLTVINWWGAF